MRRKRSTMPILEDHKSHYHDAGDRVYSYSTVILERHSGLTIGNVTYYSVTTSRHQSKAGSRLADVVLDNVPQGTADLYAFAKERGLVEYVHMLGKVMPILKNGEYRHVYSN